MKKLKKTTLGLTEAGMITGVGGSIVTKAGGSAEGLSNLSKAMPRIGNIAGASTALSLLGGINMSKKKRRKKKKKR